MKRYEIALIISVRMFTLILLKGSFVESVFFVNMKARHQGLRCLRKLPTLKGLRCGSFLIPMQ